MWTNFGYFYLHCAMRLSFNTVGIVMAILIQLFLTFLSIIVYIWELEANKHELMSKP